VSFISIELSVYVLFAWGLYTAVRRGRLDAMSLIATCIVSFLVEFIFATNIADLPAWLQPWIAGARKGSDDGYDYGTFLVMVGGVPLWVVLGWGSIVQAAMRTTAKLGFGVVLAALADGLLAASVDFGLDPIAEQLGYWKWWMSGHQPGLNTAFGIPLDNFLGWMMIVGGLSLTLRIACQLSVKWGSRLWVELACLTVAMAFAFVIAVGLQSVWDWLYARVTPAGTFMLVYGAAGLLTVTRLPWLRRDAPIDVWSLSLIGYFHLFFLTMLVTQRVYVAQPVLIAFMPLMAAGSLLAFAWPSSATLLERIKSARGNPVAHPRTTDEAPARPSR